MQKVIYSKNAITEALIDIQVNHTEEPSIEALKKFQVHLGPEYSTVKERQAFQTTFQVGRDGTPQPKPIVSIEGYEFWNGSNDKVVQARKNGFSFSKLRPYGSWEEHYPVIMGYWKKYRELYKPISTRRLAVRFINQFEIKESEIRLEDYFCGTPNVPPTLQQDLLQYLYRVVLPLDVLTNAIVTLAPGVPSSPEAVGILLDIDVHTNLNVPISDAIEIVFEKLHKHAETIFEAYITDKTRELIR